MRRKIEALVLIVFLGASLAVLATTWASKDMECPLCGKTTKMEVIASYGSYIYNWPSKHQLIFWPVTTGLPKRCMAAACWVRSRSGGRPVPS